MPPRRRAPTVEAPRLEDYLTYETNSKYTPQALYAHMQSVPDLPEALGFPAGVGPPSLDINGPALRVTGKSERIGRDEFIPLILAKLKDPRLPINCVHIWNQNFLLTRNPPPIRAISSFPNVCALYLCHVECSEDQFISLIRSYPNLKRLVLDNISIREYESGSRAHADPAEAISVSASAIRDGQRGPEIELISVYVDNITGWTLLDLFASRRSPVALRDLTMLMLPHNTEVICNDTNFVPRLSRLISLCPRLASLDIDHFNIVSPLAPLDLSPSIRDIQINVFITGNFETNMVLNWWASTLNQLTHPRYFSKVTIGVELDVDHIPREAWDNLPTHVPGWAALDQALIRPQLTVYEVKVQVMKYKPTLKGFSRTAMSAWFSTVCLPKTQKTYGTRRYSFSCSRD
ncbi:hypothetical protein IW261DRAFT_1509546 [Armillaria novae-zelandiae]|uniref:F-box domain-containing protein n=1 Tax=Armillaria novae-zelandiae TaxID=153914 RepID=A0AA39NU96_9AGAR|nr:hypothetical protein IW261DRAFT_1509546 [Armillaria novae-zelandiae]